jgi:Arc/MetJ-type ribon-helix-helix transcriptional regulator
MDLSDMLKEASVVDHDWYGAPCFDPEEKGIRKRNNITPELEIQWGNAPGVVDIDEPAGVVERNIPDDYPSKDVSGVIVFARDQMNRGMMGKALRSALHAKFDSETLKLASEALQEQFEMEGVAGCIAVDGRGYKSCQDALKIAMNSPYKRSIKYVIGCQCGTPHVMPASENSRIGAVCESSGNAMDDFLASNSDVKTSMVSHCRSTMLPILSWKDDLDPQWADETFINIQNAADLPQSVCEEIREKRKSGKISSDIECIREAFRRATLLRESNDSDKYAGSVDNSEYIIHPLEDVLEIDSVPEEELEVDGVNHALQQEVEPLESLPSHVFDEDVDMFGDMSELDLSGQPDLSQVPVELTDETNESELLFDDVESPAEVLDVDASQGDMEADVSGVSMLDDVDIQPFEEEEFVGVGDIEIDEEPEPVLEVGVDMRPDMTI